MTTTPIAHDLNALPDRAPLLRLTDSDVLHESMAEDIDQTLTDDSREVEDFTKDFFYVLDLRYPTTQLREIVSGYATKISDQHDEDALDELSTADYIEFITGCTFPVIPGVTIVVANDIFSSDYPTIDAYCAQHRCTLDDVLIA